MRGDTPGASPVDELSVLATHWKGLRSSGVVDEASFLKQGKASPAARAAVCQAMAPFRCRRRSTKPACLMERVQRVAQCEIGLCTRSPAYAIQASNAASAATTVPITTSIVIASLP